MVSMPDQIQKTQPLSSRVDFRPSPVKDLEYRNIVQQPDFKGGVALFPMACSEAHMVEILSFLARQRKKLFANEFLEFVGTANFQGVQACVIKMRWHVVAQAFPAESVLIPTEWGRGVGDAWNLVDDCCDFIQGVRSCVKIGLVSVHEVLDLR